MGLIKRGKVWWMDFMFHGRRVRRSTETSDKRLAAAILAKVTTQVVEGTFFDTREEDDHTFRDMMERYLAERSNMKAPKSCVRDGTSLKHLVPVLGEKLLSEITPKSLVAYRTQRRTERAAPATINKELQLVRHAFNLAMREWEWCRENPMHRVSLEQVRNEVDRWLTADEEDRLLAASSSWLQEIIRFALNTGMRQGEILNLQWAGCGFHAWDAHRDEEQEWHTPHDPIEQHRVRPAGSQTGHNRCIIGTRVQDSLGQYASSTLPGAGVL